VCPALACAEGGPDTAVAHRLGVDRNRQNAGRVITPGTRPAMASSHPATTDRVHGAVEVRPQAPEDCHCAR
jgi:hypothetical protein